MTHINSRSHDHPSIARRQRQVPRLANDVCIKTEASVFTSAMVELVDSSHVEYDVEIDLYAKSDICLCLSSVPLFIQTDKRTKTLVDCVGEEKVEKKIKSLVRFILSCKCHTQ
jgi:hypothetical protein